ncbi:hypothetical protein D3C86_1699490 [compost metagenome]
MSSIKRSLAIIELRKLSRYTVDFSNSSSFRFAYGPYPTTPDVSVVLLPKISKLSFCRSALILASRESLSVVSDLS